MTGLTDSLLGCTVGLGLLLIPYAIGGMGAGDVKLFAGVGAWVGCEDYPGCVLCVGRGGRRFGACCWWLSRITQSRLQRRIQELGAVPDGLERTYDHSEPEPLAELAAARKPTAILLPYGIPLAIGTVAYFFYLGML